MSSRDKLNDKVGIDRAMQVFTEWHVDEITDAAGAAKYGRRLVERLADAGVALVATDIPEQLEKAEPPLGLGRVAERPLAEQRQDEAEYIYQNGHPDQFYRAAFPQIEDADDWEISGKVFRRTAYVAHEPEDDLDQSTRPMILTITFQEDTTDVESVDFRSKN